MVLLFAIVSFTTPARAAMTLPNMMNFQGRLTDSSGNPLNGSYDMQLKLWDAASGGTARWVETRLATNGQAVTVTNGLFTLKLGVGSTVTTGVLNTVITTYPSLFFEVTVGAETLTTRTQLATSAYAFNSDTLDGIDSTSFSQLSAANAFTNTNSVTTSNANAFVVNSGSSNLFKVDTTGTGQVVIGTANASGTVLVLDTKNDNSTDPTGADGAMYYNSIAGKFRCYQASAWGDCITATSTLQTAYNASNSPATITTTAAKGVSIIAGAAPTANLFTVDNSSFANVTGNVNGIAVNYAGGAAGVEGAGVRVDFAPGSTSGGTWSGLRVVANATGPASGVTAYGIKLEGPTSAGAGSGTGMYIGTGWDLGIDIQSGGIQLSDQADPATPAAGNLRIYAKDIAGRIMPKFVGPSGVDTPIQASLGFNRVSMITPAGGTSGTTFIGGFGSTFTNVATAYANTALSSTSLLNSTRRATFTGTTTAGSIVSHRQSTLQVWRGNNAGMGGFFYTIRFATTALQAGNRAFVGLSSSTAAPTNIDPLTYGTSISRIGVAINANTGNWYFVTNNAGTAPTTTDLGGTMPVNATDLYELVLFSPPNGSSVGYRLKNISTGDVVSGSAASNLPASTTFLAPQFWMTNNATALAQAISFGGWYLESDQ